MQEYQPQFRKIEVKKQPIRGGNNSILNSSIADIGSTQHAQQQYPANTNNAFSVLQSNKYELNSMHSFSLEAGKNELLENIIPIKIKQQGKEDYSSMLTLKVFTAAKPSSNSSAPSVLRIELTDEANNLFLYVMELSESEFIHLKKEQDIRVDFSQFPQMISNFIELCFNEDNEKVKFSCVLDIKNQNEADLNIVEVNPFKVINHLSLRLRSANDDTLKNFLSKKLAQAKQENEQLRIENSKQEQELHCRNMEVQINSEELRKLQEEKKRSLEEVRLEEQQKLHSVKEEQLKKEETIRRQLESQKNDLQERYDREVNALSSKNEALSQKCQNQSERLIELESKLKEMTTKNAALDRESSMTRNQLEQLQIENRKLNEFRYENEKKIAELTFLNQGMNQQIKDKQHLAIKNQDLADNINNHKDLLQQQCEDQKEQINKYISKLELCSEEINKGNQIIQKLQSELAKQKGKIKMKNQMMIKQEAHLEEVKTREDQLKAEMLKKERENNSLSLQQKESQQTIEDFKQKLQESQKIIENNQSVIQFLNKQMNEQGSGKLGAAVKPLLSTSPMTYSSNFSTHHSQLSTFESRYTPNPTGTGLTSALPSGITRKYSSLDLHGDNSSTLPGATTTSPYSKEITATANGTTYTPSSNLQTPNSSSYQPSNISNLQTVNTKWNPKYLNNLTSPNNSSSNNPNNASSTPLSEKIQNNNNNTNTNNAKIMNPSSQRVIPQQELKYQQQQQKQPYQLVAPHRSLSANEDSEQHQDSYCSSNSGYSYAPSNMKQVENNTPNDQNEFNQKYLAFANKTNWQTEEADEPHKVTPIKYKQPKAPNQ